MTIRDYIVVVGHKLDEMFKPNRDKGIEMAKNIESVMKDVIDCYDKGISPVEAAFSIASKLNLDVHDDLLD